MYAIQLADFLVLQRDDLAMRLFLTPKVEMTPVDIGRGKFDSFILPFGCADGQAAAIVEVLRKRYSKEQLRCYRKGERGGWKRV